nr:immunoglobulin light chain junction region [Macaca mulatta]MOV73521.1 immunoglobulin light chain junction region [Macaca mulatta]
DYSCLSYDSSLSAHYIF